MRLKSYFYLKIGLVIMLMIQISCYEQTPKAPLTTPQAIAKTDTILSENKAQAQIIIDIESISGNTLAYITLDFQAFINKKGKYKVKILNVDEGDSGPFNTFKIVEKAVISKNDEIRVLLSFELQTERINWEIEKGKLTAIYGKNTAKQTLQSEGGSLHGTATLVFDEHSMNLMAQSSDINNNEESGFKNEASNFQGFQSFAAKYLDVRLATTVFWTNAACPNMPCTTGQMREMKKRG